PRPGRSNVTASTCSAGRAISSGRRSRLLRSSVRLVVDVLSGWGHRSRVHRRGLAPLRRLQDADGLRFRHPYRLVFALLYLPALGGAHELVVVGDPAQQDDLLAVTNSKN